MCVMTHGVIDEVRGRSAECVRLYLVLGLVCTMQTVSYTHLDVYKRQVYNSVISVRNFTVNLNTGVISMLPLHTAFASIGTIEYPQHIS